MRSVGVVVALIVVGMCCLALFAQEPALGGDLRSSSTNAVFAQGAASVEHAYCIVDLSGGPNAVSYPVSYLDEPPTNGWSDVGKSTKLILRWLRPGSFTMGKSCEVTLSRGFYMGVFEVTQKQYELVMGENPSRLKGDRHPVDSVTWSALRGLDVTNFWPNCSLCNATSFVGRLRLKTNFLFDLPTEAQWEYACRKGDRQTGKVVDVLDSGLFWDNRNASTIGHGEVGMFLANAWGGYDMYGNVWERCLDWNSSLQDEATDPVGPEHGRYRVVRGGCWYFTSKIADLSYRKIYVLPDEECAYVGVRLVCVPPCMNADGTPNLEIAPIAKADDRNFFGKMVDWASNCFD